MNSGDLTPAWPDELSATIAFGPFHYDAARRELSDGCSILRVGSRALHLLEVLLEQPGRLYSRDELVARVWPQTVVEETSLRVHVSALRRALGDGLNGARYIVNVPGRGYAFVGEVRASRPPVRQAPPQRALDTGPQAPSSFQPPVRLSRLIGRETVIQRLTSLLARERLVTITGAGGMGKTTVAWAVAERSRRGFGENICLVDLSHLSDPDLVVAEVARTQGLSVAPGGSADVLDAALCHARLLFVLDNCEHLIDAVATLVGRLMRTCPGIHFLATSREPLDIEAEWIFKLPPLGVPAAEESLDLQGLMTYPAIQLFVERAQANGDSFELTEAHAPGVRQLCGYLEGIPLAIELAAARVPALGVQGLLQRLENAFELLTRGRRTALSRHRTLQAVMDWSYDLLSDAERLVLQRLAVFRGVFDLDGAVAIAAGEQLSRQGVIEAVLSLTTKSLMLLASAEHDRLTYRLLYITRLYAEKRLTRGDDEQEVHRRHATFIASGLEQVRRASTSVPDHPRTTAPAPAIADVRAAIEWALIDAHDVGLGIRVVAFAKRIYDEAGLVEEYLRYIDTALAKLPSAGTDIAQLELPLRVAAGFMLGYVADGSSRHLEVFSRTRELLSATGSEEDRIEALYGMSTTHYGQGDYHLSIACCEEIRRLSTGRFEPLSIGIADRVQALCLHALGQHDEAEVLARRVMAFDPARVPRRFLSEVPFAVSMGAQLTRIHWLRGEFSLAWSILERCLAESASAHVFARCQALATAAIPMAIWRGDTSLAIAWTQELHDLSARNGLRYWMAYATAFAHVAKGTAIPPGDALATMMTNCPPLGETVAACHASPPVALTRRRVDQGAVGWCAPEVMRLVALEERDVAPAAASRRLDEALRVAESQGARFWMLRIALTRAAVVARPGATPEVRQSLAQLLSTFDDDITPPEVNEARVLLKAGCDGPQHGDAGA